MNLEKQLIVYLKNNVIKACSILGIESVIFEREHIRGMDEKQTTIILHEHGLSVPFTSMGLARLSLLNSRLSLGKDEEFSVTAEEDTKNPGVISKLTIKSKKFKVDFRAANPNAIKAPKGSKSTFDSFLCAVKLSQDDMDLILKASNSLPQKTETGTICFLGDPDTGKMMVVLTDTNNDDFEMLLDSEVEFNVDDKLAVNYPLKQFLTLMKNNDGDFKICDRNILKSTVCGITVIMLPVL